MRIALPLLIAWISSGINALAAPPVVSNVVASQRPGTKLVDVYYDLTDSDGDPQLVQMQVSGDGGLTYTIPCVTLSGHIGAGVTPGSNRHIVWNAGTDWNGQFVQNTKVRVTAYDGTTPPPPPGMALVPAGTFQMGDNLDEMGAETLPVHAVYLDSFFIDRYEIHKEIWQNVMAWAIGNGYVINGGGFKDSKHPVQGVSWHNAIVWCNARSEKEGLVPCYYTDTAKTVTLKSSSGVTNVNNSTVDWHANGYRLPTEAEWEKAARGGTFGQRYPWGSDVFGSHANFQGSGDNFEGQIPGTTPVGYYDGGQTPAGVDMMNGYGIYDMAGNVQEMCWDWYSSSYYGLPEAGVNPHGPLSGTEKVFRGGAYNGDQQYLRCAMRSRDGPTFNNRLYNGFRCVRNP